MLTLAFTQLMLMLTQLIHQLVQGPIPTPSVCFVNGLLSILVEKDNTTVMLWVSSGSPQLHSAAHRWHLFHDMNLFMQLFKNSFCGSFHHKILQ